MWRAASDDRLARGDNTKRVGRVEAIRSAEPRRDVGKMLNFISYAK